MKRPIRSAEALKTRSRQGLADAPPRARPINMDLEIGEIGARGDAIAAAPEGARGGPIYVPYALPGEQVKARVSGDRAEIVEIVQASAERIAPICQHFGRCGGCQLQHWRAQEYLNWKRDLVVKQMARRELAVEVDPIIAAWGEGRRRAAFHANAAGRFGFMARGSNGLIDIRECPVLTPGLQAALPKLRALGVAFAPARGDVTVAVLETDAGLDVELKGAGAPSSFGRAKLEEAARVADEHDLARLSFNGETALARRVPTLRMGRAIVAPPPGAFTQPTKAGEEALAALAIEALKGSARIADLFCGVGTFALRFAEHAEVHGVDGAGELVNALKTAADAAGGEALKQVTVERRDLLRAPVSPLELKRFDAIAFDPPRSGARLQAEQIARSKAERVAAISCDPVAFARDAKILVDGGFTLTRVTPVDQFRFSPHVEIVGAFSR